MTGLISRSSAPFLLSSNPHELWWIGTAPASPKPAAASISQPAKRAKKGNESYAQRDGQRFDNNESAGMEKRRWSDLIDVEGFTCLVQEDCRGGGENY